MTENKTQNIKGSIYGVLIIIAIIAIMAALVWFFNAGGGNIVPSTTGTSSPSQDFSGSVTLHNEEYGFDMTVPAGINAETIFKKYYALSDKWRVNAPESGPGSDGKAVVSIPVLQMDNNEVSPKVYPLSFDAEVRVGVSLDTKSCYDKDDGYTSQKVTDVTINGVVFKHLSFSDAAMMHYVQGESYRTIHNNLCFVVEQVKTGSSYREPGMEEALGDKDLAEYYAQAAEVVQSFKFTK